MGRGRELSGEICIEVNGEVIPYLLIDEKGNKTWLVSEEDQQKYEQKMLKNIGETMSRFYTAHPEYLEKECQNEQRQRQQTA